MVCVCRTMALCVGGILTGSARMHLGECLEVIDPSFEDDLHVREGWVEKGKEEREGEGEREGEEEFVRWVGIVVGEGKRGEGGWLGGYMRVRECVPEFVISPPSSLLPRPPS